MRGLAELVGEVRASVEGAAVALLVGLDGMVVAGSGQVSPVASWELLAAHYVEVLRTAREASREARLEPPAELVICSASGTLLLRSLAGGFALLVLVSSGTLLGKARHELRRAAERILPEIA